MMYKVGTTENLIIMIFHLKFGKPAILLFDQFDCVCPGKRQTKPSFYFIFLVRKQYHTQLGWKSNVSTTLLTRAMSIDSKSIDAFVEKAMNVEETIKGIANGTIEPDDVDLQEYGILTKEQEKEEEDRKARRKLEHRRVEKERKDKEREQWWKLAQMQQGVRNTSEVSNLEHVKEAEVCYSIFVIVFFPRIYFII